MKRHKPVLVLDYTQREMPRHHLMIYFWLPTLTLLATFWVVIIKAILEVL